MKLDNIETLLLQEMENVRGGASGTCICNQGAKQSSGGGGECRCESAAAQIDTGTDPKPDTCMCSGNGALQK